MDAHWEAGRGGGSRSIVYPVSSRRSGGLSLGLNLFPRAKVCGFDCPYCEIFPPSSRGEEFSISGLEAELGTFLGRDYPQNWAPRPIRDLCFSGNGEPTASPFLGAALEACARVRRHRPELLAEAALVLITNSTGFLDPATRALLEGLHREEGLIVWAKLDAGSEGLFRLMSGGQGPSLAEVAGGILEFSRRTPVVLQTMLCVVEGRSPTQEDLADYAKLVLRLLAGGARVDEIQLYTYARASPGAACASLSDGLIAGHASFLRESTALPVRCFGRFGELDIAAIAHSAIPGQQAGAGPR